MRITTLLVTGLFMACSTQVIAQTNNPNLAWAKCMAHAKRGQDCIPLYVPHEDTSGPDSYYEFQAWKVDQNTAREIEAIDRNYELRKSGVLP